MSSNEHLLAGEYTTSDDDDDCCCCCATTDGVVKTMPEKEEEEEYIIVTHSDALTKRRLVAALLGFVVSWFVQMAMVGIWILLLCENVVSRQTIQKTKLDVFIWPAASCVLNLVCAMAVHTFYYGAAVPHRKRSMTVVAAAATSRGANGELGETSSHDIHLCYVLGTIMGTSSLFALVNYYFFMMGLPHHRLVFSAIVLVTVVLVSLILSHGSSKCNPFVCGVNMRMRRRCRTCHWNETLPYSV